ncbi:MAG: hypothetical protein LBR10_05265 [Prevotellaceae bacterium]|nr:hypothetical protein [Prevotellaceae bacterium]
MFSFYNKWDGRQTAEIRTYRFKTQNSINGKPIRQPGETELTINFNYEEVCIYKRGCKISEDDLLKMFPNKNIIPFVFIEDYEDWKHTRKILQTKDRLLVLINKSYKKYPQYIERTKRDDLKMEHFDIFVFETCNSEAAEFVNLDFDNKEIYTIIGGIKANNNYNFVNNVLGCWYDFALPRIKINAPSPTKVFIDSEEIIIEKNQVDLSNLISKKTNQKYQIEPRRHSFQCAGISPAYFFVEEYKANAGAAINHGWIITANDLRPVKKGEKPNIIGLKIKKPNEITDNNNLRPFLNPIDYLRNRLLDRFLDKKLKAIERRRNYGY